MFGGLGMGSGLGLVIGLPLKIAMWSIRLQCSIVKAFWNHPVLRLVLLIAVGAPGSVAWWNSTLPPGSHAWLIGGIVIGASWLWWLFVMDAIHRLVPHGATGFLRGGYSLLTYPLWVAWDPHRWLDGTIVIVLTAVVLLFPLLWELILGRKGYS